MKLLKDLIFAVFHPGYWVMLKPYSAIWDRELNQAMGRYRFAVTGDGYHASLGPYKRIWIENHPYASFEFCDVRPARRTIYWAHKKLIEDRLHFKKVKWFEAGDVLQLRIAKELE